MKERRQESKSTSEVWTVKLLQHKHLDVSHIRFTKVKIHFTLESSKKKNKEIVL